MFNTDTKCSVMQKTNLELGVDGMNIDPLFSNYSLSINEIIK
jgi:hypothetical protein